MLRNLILSFALRGVFLLALGMSLPASGEQPDGWVIGGASFAKSRTISAADHGLMAGATSDQTDKLNDAIRHVEASAEIDTLFIPEGVYRITGHVQLRPRVNIIGAGIGQTVFERRDEGNYLMWSRALDGQGAMIAHLTLDNRARTVLLQGGRNLQFYGVEFRGGIVRLEGCSDISLSHCVFSRNIGKAAYAGSDCSNISLTHNRFNSIENGSINLSGHRDSYAAYNHITAETLLDSGYAGIRLPNGALNNIVENNLIENHGRGLFVLSSSAHNTLRGNVVKNTTYQGILIQSSDNTIQGNVVINAGDESIYVVDATQDSSPTPSLALRNRIIGNTIYDTQPPRDHDRHVALRVLSGENIVRGNVVSTTHGRAAMQISDRGNRVVDNITWDDPVVPSPGRED